MRIKYFVIRFVILCSFSGLMLNSVSGQEEKEVKGVKGEGIIVGRVSEAEARKDAINRAKIEALRKAGIAESITSYQMLFKSEVENNFTEFFSSDVQTEIQGAVRFYKIVKEERKSNEHYFSYEVILDATVVIYDKHPDVEFNVQIGGIKSIYENGEMLSFNIVSTKDTYLHIFSIDDNVASLVYPGQYEEFRMITASNKIRFPYGADYELYKDGAGPVFNRLVFVFTKEKVHFLDHTGDAQETTSEKIFSWVYGLSPDQRVVQYKTFSIR